MSCAEIHKRLQDVFRLVFDEDDIEIFAETTAEDIDAWDSLEHINLVIAVEREFNVRFATAEISGLKNVGEFEALLLSKLGIS